MYVHYCIMFVIHLAFHIHISSSKSRNNCMMISDSTCRDSRGEIVVDSFLSPLMEQNLNFPDPGNFAFLISVTERTPL